MEPTQISKESKTPRFSRAISWLGGALFGRSPRQETVATPHASDGAPPLILLDAAMVATVTLQDVLGVRLCLAATLSLIVLCGDWLRRFYKTTVPFYRWVAVAVLAMELLLFLPLYLYLLIHDPH